MQKLGVDFSPFKVHRRHLFLEEHMKGWLIYTLFRLHHEAVSRAKIYRIQLSPSAFEGSVEM
ncbi:MAG: hypothetical protein U0T80_06980 [Flavobacteriaceae bacterium]